MLVHLTPNSFKDHPEMVADYQRVRKVIFHDRLNWDVQLDGDREIDEFDSEYSHYLLALQDNKVIGGVRLTPSFFPNLTYEVFEKFFPEGISADRSMTLLETSRFGLVFTDNGSGKTLRSHTFDLFTGMVKFALDYGYESIITVVDVRMERTLRLAGWPLQRITEVVQIGETKTVIGLLPISLEIHDSLKAKAESNSE